MRSWAWAWALVGACALWAGCDLSVVSVRGPVDDEWSLQRPPERAAPEQANPYFEAETTCDAQPTDPGEALARRLTNLEYVHTVEDLLGVPVADLASRLPRETRVAGFRNAARALTASGPLIDHYRTLAGEVSARLSGADWLARHAGCDLGESACEAEFVRAWGLRFFRRPLRAEEIERYQRLFRVVEGEGEGFERGARLVIEAFLQSPHFLYRVESHSEESGVARVGLSGADFERRGFVSTTDRGLAPLNGSSWAAEHRFEAGEYRVGFVARGPADRVVLEVGRHRLERHYDSPSGATGMMRLEIEEPASRPVVVSIEGGAVLTGVDIVGPLDTAPTPGPTREHDTVRPVDDWEMASRLSYFIWHSAPDERLLEAARAGRLRAEEDLRAQVRRMLDDPRARRAFRAYISEWLHLDTLDTAERDTRLHPGFDEELVAEMKAETLALFEHLVWEADAELTRALTAQRTWVGPRLAELYGLNSAADRTREVDLSDRPERGGLLTHASLLTLTTPNDITSPVRRGLFVRTHLMCQPVAPPPPDVPTSAASVDPSASKRRVLEQHSRTSTCATCHAQMDPIGFGLEAYDAVGRHRTHDLSGHRVAEESYLQSGERVAHFEGPTELAELLADSEAVSDCMIQKVYQFATGRAPARGDACDLQRVRERYRQQGSTYPGLVEAVVLSDAFRYVRVYREQEDP